MTDTMSPTAQLQSAWETAKDGNDVDGTIDCGEAYISYTAEAIGGNGARYFTVQIGIENEFLRASPTPPSVSKAMAAVIRVIDETPLPDSGEYSASKRL